jgi:hypothetical protein
MNNIHIIMIIIMMKIYILEDRNNIGDEIYCCINMRIILASEENQTFIKIKSSCIYV